MRLGNYRLVYFDSPNWQPGNMFLYVTITPGCLLFYRRPGNTRTFVYFDWLTCQHVSVCEYDNRTTCLADLTWLHVSLRNICRWRLLFYRRPGDTRLFISIHRPGNMCPADLTWQHVSVRNNYRWRLLFYRRPANIRTWQHLSGSVYYDSRPPI
jgi:hypothetical protein